MAFRSIMVLVAFLAAFPAQGEELKGRPQVLGGDIIEIGGEQIRLFGIDAPELDQECRSSKGRTYGCGVLAARALIGIIGRDKVVCQGEQRDRGGRLVAVCYVGAVGWLNINELMVADGWAMADPEQGADYARAEKAAKARNEGLWKGTFVPPWEWLKGKRLPR